MPDPRFFKNHGPFTLGKLAEIASAQLSESGASEMEIKDVAALNVTEMENISFLDNIKYKEQFLNTKAGACIVSAEMAKHAPDGCVLLISNSPYKSYALIAQHFYPDNEQESKIAESARIHETAEIGENVTIEENAVIGAGVKIGRNSRIGANAVISHAIIGDYVRLYPGVCVGQDGFGFAIDPAGHVKVPQLGRVIIEDHVEIGANTCIDRGAGPDTVIGQGTWIDNLVQIGHNVKIGKGCIIVSQVGISGSTVIDDYVALGGQVGVAGHLHIGKGVQVAAKSGIMRDIPDGANYMGYPAKPMKEFMKQTAYLSRLIKKSKSS